MEFNSIKPFQFANNNIIQKNYDIKNISYIDDYGFFNCQFEYIYEHNSVKKIGKNSFGQSKKLKKIFFDKNTLITEIENGTFHRCEQLIDCKLPLNTKYIKDEAFRQCINLIKIEFPISLEKIGKYAFERCFNLNNIIFPSELNIIGSHSFDSCFNLREIKIYAKKIIIQDNAFTMCTKLENITIESEQIFIDDTSFIGCENLKKINIKKSLLKDIDLKSIFSTSPKLQINIIY